MRVLFVTHTGASLGGAEHSLLLLLKHLPVDVRGSLLLFEDGPYAAMMRENGFQVTVLPMAAELLAVTRERLFQPEAARALRAGIASVREQFRLLSPDVVHSNSIKAHFIAGIAARWAGIPVVMHFRDFLPGLGRIALTAASRALAAERIACSSVVARWYGYPPTVGVVNPVEIAKYRELPDRVSARADLGLDARPVIGIVGRINRWKGHDRFLRIVARVNAVVPVQALIVGEARFRDADFVPELEQLAATLGLRDAVRFVPWQNDLRPIFSALDVHCNCSEREPFGRTIAEASAAGCPTVSFDDGGAVDIITDGATGSLIRPADENGFANAILSYLRDEPLRLSVGAAARRDAERFEPERHGRRVAEILRRAACRAS